MNTKYKGVITGRHHHTKECVLNFPKNPDLYILAAALKYKIPYEQVTKKQREELKIEIFSFYYAASPEILDVNLILNHYK